MGPLTLPASGSIYLDANSVIYSVEQVKPYHRLLALVWNAPNPNAPRIVTSELTLMEVLVKPFMTANARLEQAFRTLLLYSSDVDLLPVSQAILERAAQLRATSGLKTPDAIHAATAIGHGCALFVTNDPAFRRLTSISVAILSDLTAP